MIVGFCGLIGSGKTTAAMRLVQEHGYWRYRFAQPLKDMLKALGLTDEQVDGKLKEVPCELLGGKTPRHAMQTIGTEWGRNLIDGDLWTRAWKAHVSMSSNPLLVTDDVRFPNEVKAIKDIGGIIVLIERPGCTPTSHASETQALTPDITITNRTTVRALEKEIDWLVENLWRQAA
jgi:hypothetical protein